MCDFDCCVKILEIMGLFKLIKNIFNKNIECGDEINNHMLFLLKNRKNVYLNKNILVRENTQCVLVHKNKVYDVILPGKYKITKEVIPLLYDKMSIDEMAKKDKKIRKIRADIFFINTMQFNDFSFLSDSPFSLKSLEMGKVKGCIQGNCSVRIIDASLLLKMVLTKCKTLKLNKIYEYMSYSIGNKVNKIVVKNKISTNILLCDNNNVDSIVNRDIESSFDNLGFFVNNVKLKSIKFKKKYQVKVNEYLAQHRRLVRPSQTSGGGISAPVSVNRGATMTVNQNNTMQRSINTNNASFFKRCIYCKCVNDSSSNFCKQCGKRL